jgi:PilZ domain
MGPCRACQVTDVRASHRRGWLERVPLTWCGILPYRCGHCQTRFYRLGWRDPRRWHPHLEDPAVDDIRAPRWSSRTSATVTVDLTVGSPVPLTERTEDLSVRGARVRLPEEIPAGTPVRLSVRGERPRVGTVRWSKADESTEFARGETRTLNGAGSHRFPTAPRVTPAPTASSRPDRAHRSGPHRLDGVGVGLADGNPSYLQPKLLRAQRYRA